MNSSSRYSAIYTLVPGLVVLCCAVAIWYSLTAPAEPLVVSEPAMAQMLNGLIPSVTPAMHQYSRLRYAIHFIWISLDTIFLWAFLRFGWANDLRNFANSRSKILFIQLAIFLALFTLTMTVALSPFSYVTGFWLRHHFGLSNQSMLNWLIDWGKAIAVNFCVALPIWWLIYVALRKFSKQWPFLVFAGSVPIIFSLTFLAPLVIDPVFNKIELMPDTPLRTSIQQVAASGGIAGAPIYSCDRHKQTNEINAYVTGLGSSARIVLWDTTLSSLPTDQILCVVAHEMGHFVLKHVYWGCAIAIAISLLLVPVNVWITPMIFKRLPINWGIESMQDIAAIPFLLLCVTVSSFLAEPAINSYSRAVEHEADMFGLRLIGNGPAFVRTFASLSRGNLAEPSPPKYVGLWLFSHPPLSERIKSVIDGTVKEKGYYVDDKAVMKR